VPDVLNLGVFVAYVTKPDPEASWQRQVFYLEADVEESDFSGWNVPISNLWEFYS